MYEQRCCCCLSARAGAPGPAWPAVAACTRSGEPLSLSLSLSFSSLSLLIARLTDAFLLPCQRVDKIFRMMDRDKNAQREWLGLGGEVAHNWQRSDAPLLQCAVVWTCEEARRSG
jgi:hypothetical protein